MIDSKLLIETYINYINVLIKIMIFVMLLNMKHISLYMSYKLWN